MESNASKSLSSSKCSGLAIARHREITARIRELQSHQIELLDERAMGLEIDMLLEQHGLTRADIQTVITGSYLFGVGSSDPCLRAWRRWIKDHSSKEKINFDAQWRRIKRNQNLGRFDDLLTRPPYDTRLGPADTVGIEIKQDRPRLGPYGRCLFFSKPYRRKKTNV